MTKESTENGKTVETVGEQPIGLIRLLHKLYTWEKPK